MAADRLVVPGPTSGSARLTPSDTASDGFVVETHVLARLLGVKLLTLEGVVLVSPAQVRRPPDAQTNGRPTESERVRSASSPHARRPLTSKTSGTTRATTTSASRSAVRATDGDGRPGSDLGRAARLLDECAGELRSLGAGPTVRR